MPSKNTKTHKLKGILSSISKKRILFEVVLIAIIFALLIGVWNFWQHQKDQIALKSDLDSSGNNLDDLALDFKAEGLSEKFNRENWCYKASRKSGPEPIYCTQRLELTKGPMSVEAYRTDLALIDKVLIQSDNFNFFKKQKAKQFDGYTPPPSYVTDTEHPNGGCSVHVSKGLNEKESHIDGYELRIECLSGNFDKFIYPEQKD